MDIKSTVAEVRLDNGLTGSHRELLYFPKTDIEGFGLVVWGSTDRFYVGPRTVEFPSSALQPTTDWGYSVDLNDIPCYDARSNRSGSAVDLSNEGLLSTVRISWGDGSQDDLSLPLVSDVVEHTYPSESAEYDITIQVSFPSPNVGQAFTRNIGPVFARNSVAFAPIAPPEG